MSAKLLLGVIDLPYTSEAPKGNRPKKAKSEGKTTGDVAEILESKYGVMKFFFDKHKEDIASDLENSVAGALETLMMGGPTLSPFAGATSKIEERFRTFLTAKEMDGQAPGVPTMASIIGVSHRFKNKRGAPGRPSFIDTGAYSASFKAWSED